MPMTLALLRQAGLLDSTDTKPLVILDNACGTGVVSHVLQTQAKERISELVCADLSPAMIDYVKKRINKEDWKSTTQVADAQDTKLPSEHFDAVVASLVIFALPDPQKGLAGQSSSHCDLSRGN